MITFLLIFTSVPRDEFLELFRLAAKKCEASEKQTEAVEEYLR